ncbi:hypothetical protein NE237_004330 [Protea cynaroides]|uniref:Glycosyltransferases n=1 Tax=Protea cynaroides TaxID=273540 RepID=A0A9Q0KIT1_9MAGN|nr:hypothetical protein NE237_004330 [Protea cynaroides]
MGSSDRSKRKIQLWKKAAFHFVFCFIVGFFSGFSPTSKASIFSNLITSNQSMKKQEISPQPTEMLQPAATQEVTFSRSVMAETPAVVLPTSSEDQQSTSPVEEEEVVRLIPRKALIVVTSTRSNDHLQGALLRRMGTTLKLVPPPLLWIVVEPLSDSSEILEILRKTGVMFRHLVSKEKFIDPEAELDNQRNVALNHIEHHRLSGIVHFAELSNYYDLGFFEEIRKTEVLRAWPIASVSENRKRVVIEGPRKSSGMNNQENPMAPIHISSFAFNSSILWDPERWGRSSSVQGTLQNSMKFVQEVVLEDETKSKGIPQGDCSKIMLWNVHIPRQIMSYHSSEKAG